MPDDEPTELKPCPRLTEQEIREIAEGLVKDRYFTATMCPPDMISMIFPIIALGGLSTIDPETIGNVIEELDKAGPRGINGYPMFFSCRVIHKEDWTVIAEKATAALLAMDEAMGKGNDEPNPGGEVLCW